MGNRGLRIGFTTGSAASAAAKAGLFAILGGIRLDKVDIPTPMGKRLTIPIYQIISKGEFAHVWVKKDGGDDPDATHGALIGARVLLDRSFKDTEIEILGGEGVGVVTKPGLPVPIGQPAINPYPRMQIKRAVLEGLDFFKVQAKVCVIIEVKDGDKIAKKTLNPRLGIKGGISILGTRGTVLPFSAEAYMETINLAMDVAKKLGITSIGLTTGGRSERLLRAKKEMWREEAFIQIADYFEFSLKKAVEKGFSLVCFGVFPGKLIKMAQGYPYTHARDTKIDFEKLSHWVKDIGFSLDICKKVKHANTGRHVVEILEVEKDNYLNFILFLGKRAIEVARGFSEYKIKIEYFVFDYVENFIMRIEE